MSKKDVISASLSLLRAASSASVSSVRPSCVDVRPKNSVTPVAGAASVPLLLGDKKASSDGVHCGAQSSVKALPAGQELSTAGANDKLGAAQRFKGCKAQPTSGQPAFDLVKLLSSTEPQDILIRELLRSRFQFNVGLHSSGQPSLREKHFYLGSAVVQYANNDTVPQANGFVLNFPALGDDYDNRIGQSIRMLRLRIRIRTEFGSNSASFAPYDQGAPGCHWLVSCQHVTATPGTVIDHFPTGNDPPNSTALYNNLSIARSSIASYAFVKSPLAKGVYTELGMASVPPYHEGGWPHQTMTIATNGTTNGAQPTIWVTTFDIDMKGRKADFGTGSVPGPLTNQVEILQYSFGPDNTSVKFQLSSDLTFEDTIEDP